MKKEKKKVKIEFNGGFRQYFATIILFILLFVLPIYIYENWAGISEEGSRVLGAYTSQELTDNRYYFVPLLNFKFDTELRDSSTIIFIAGIFILIIGAIASLLLWIDFRRRQHKYD